MENEDIIGHRIAKIRAMTQQELNAEGWDLEANMTAIELDNGVVLYPSADEEGNYGGEIFGTHNGKQFHLYNE